MHGEYIEQRNGGYYVAGTRLLAKAYGAIPFYLDHKVVIDQYLESSKFESDAVAMADENPALWERLQRHGQR